MNTYTFVTNWDTDRYSVVLTPRARLGDAMDLDVTVKLKSPLRVTSLQLAISSDTEEMIKREVEMMIRLALEKR